MAEPDITGGGGGNLGGATRTAPAARLGAKVTVDGVEKLDSKFKSLLGTLRQVRTELQTINNGGKPVNGGIADNSSTSRLGEMIKGFGAGGPGGQGSTVLAGLGSLSMLGFNTVNNRMTRNMAESVGISATDTKYSSMYGFNYRGAETNRFLASGTFGGSRPEQLRAATLGFSYGQSYGQNTQFMSSMGNVVQASGGTMSIGQAAESAGDFLDPIVMRRAAAMGITPGRVGGQVSNPLETAMGYLRHFQERNGELNRVDFENMSSAGSPIRYGFARRYGLDDSAIDQIQQAGMQNITFREKTGSGRDINFESDSDLEAIGASGDKLGLRSQELSTAVGRRDARFFAQQEGAMVNRLGQEITIQDTLAEVEDKFGSLIGVLYQLENVVKGVVAGFMGLGMLGMGPLARGGGGVAGAAGAIGMAAGGMGGIGGVPMGSGPVGSSMTGGPSSPIGGPVSRGARVAGLARGVGTAGMGAAFMFGGSQMAGSSSALGAAAGIGSMAAGGAMIGSVLPGPGTAIGAGVGAAAGAAAAIHGAISRNDEGEVGKGRAQAAGMSDRVLINSLTDYIKSDLKAARGGEAGPQQRGRFDIWAGRRSSLVAALLTEANEAGDLSGLSTEEAAKVGQLIAFFSSEETSNDEKFRNKAEEVLPYVEMVKEENRQLYRRFFGSAPDPFADTPVATDEYQSMIMTSQQTVDAYMSRGAPGGGGDPVGKNTAGMAFPTSKGVGPGHASWDNLDGRMKTRLTNLLRAAGGRLWVGNGWRDPNSAHTHNEFLRRHYEDPNGKLEYKGKRYSLRAGMAPYAPPGKSNHNIGLAADLEGDMDWLQQNAARFGLKTFADVINEPWHVQLAELANGFLGEGANQGTGYSNEGAAEAIGDGGIPPSASRSVLGTSSGIGFSAGGAIDTFDAAAALSGGGGGGGGEWAGTSASTTAGAANVAPWSGGNLTAEQVAVMAHQAGFRGQDLIDVVAIAKRESSYNPGALNPNAATRDYSFGLMQINMIGDLGPSRRQQFGIQSNEQLYDPMTNLRAAYMLYQQSGNTLEPWGGYKGEANTYNTDVAAAARAVAAAGLGDPVGSYARPDFPSSSAPSASGAGVHIDFGGVVIQSSGNARYDADAFLQAVAPKIEAVAGMALKRAGG